MADHVDSCFARLERAASEAGWLLVMTADHGNAEQMVDPATGQPHTAHTTNPAPFVVCRRDLALAQRGDGTLADVAPTVLGLQGLSVPKEMTGRDLPGDGRRKRILSPVFRLPSSVFYCTSNGKLDSEDLLLFGSLSLTARA